MIKFNSSIKLILSDVDETIADVYTEATPEMIEELNLLLREGRILFLISGGGLQSIQKRILDKLVPQLRYRVLTAHCSGAEVWGFQTNGYINTEPYYSVYDDALSENKRKHGERLFSNL